MPKQVNLYEAKTQLSSLVEQAAKGEEIIIAKAGKPMVRLVPAEQRNPQPRRTSGQNLLGITFKTRDWEKDIPLDYFQDEGQANPFEEEPGMDQRK